MDISNRSDSVSEVRNVYSPIYKNHLGGDWGQNLEHFKNIP